MPDYSGDTAVMRLFRQRNAQRQGQQLTGENATQFDALSKWGANNLGVAAPAMPGKPVERGEAAVPAGDTLSSMAPPRAGSSPAGQTEAMSTRADPVSPGRGNGLLQRRSIPALDALAEAPKKRNRGLIHRRDVGRVM